MTMVQFIDVVLMLVVIEAVVLCIALPKRWPHLSRAAVLAMLGAGGVLMLALRAVASGASVMAVMGWMALALVAHLIDLRFRLGT
jgi:hypothetical protein